MAAHPAGVRLEKRSAGPLEDGSPSGVVGDPTKATVEFGTKGLELKIETAIRQYRELRREARSE